MNKPKSNAAAFAVWTLVSCGVHFVLFREKVQLTLPVLQRILMAVAAVVLVLPVHEWIHLVFMKIFGQGKVKLIFAKDRLGLPMPGVLAERRGTRGQEIIMRLAPFVLLTILPDILFAFSSRIHLFFFIVAICNSAGCFYDGMDVWRLIREEKENKP